ncbi:hypothetical protein LZD49_03900 [Dyadobacter sp. CY261]|uniref:hypothetical protein n=1 Tax=Dyadobacter sp. CY261 TaxID=2907203 RepID=UPI001F34F17D|nr:hypothetical protein [Dyadobacter sp. CY261]MCF0069600.1 hypothetical protein [Dyadobacter sp. CY261]
MPESKVIRSDWRPADQLIVSQISGDLEMQDVIRWEKTLHDALDKVSDSGTFKIFVNLYGFTAANLETHKYFRNIIPLTLAEYGWKVGYVNMFPEEAEKLTVTRKRGVQCIAAAHCHQDAGKIEKYEQLYSSENEHFYTNPDLAFDWIIRNFPSIS